MPSKRSDHELAITTRVKDLASKDIVELGEKGKKAGDSIALGFIKAQLTIGAFKAAVRGAVAFVRGMTDDVAAQADAIGKLSLRLGISTEALSEFRHVAGLADQDFNAFAISLQRQTRRLASAAEGTGEAVAAIEALRQYGLPTAQELARMAPEDQFMALAEALGQVENQGRRVALAFKLWDSEGVKNLQIVNQGTEAIRAQREEARRLGVVVTDELANVAAAYNDAKLRLDTAITGIRFAIGSELLPVLTEGLERLAFYLADHREQIRDVALDIIRTVADFTVEAIAGTLKVAGDFADLVASAKAFFDDPFGALTSGLGDRVSGNVDRLGRMLGLKDAIEMDELFRVPDLSTGDRLARDFRALVAQVKRNVAAAWEGAGQDAGEQYQRGLSDSLGAVPGQKVDLEAITREFEKQIDLLRAQTKEARALLQIEQQIESMLRDLPADLFDFSGLDEATNQFFLLVEEFRDLSIEQVVMDDFTESIREQGEAAKESAQWLRDMRDAAREAREEEERRQKAEARKAYDESFVGAIDYSISQVPALSQQLGDLVLPTMTGAFDTFFASITDGSRSAAEAFKSFGRDVLQTIGHIANEVLAAQTIKLFFSAFGITMPSVNLGSFAAPKPMAEGGIVTKPTFALIGEAGPEAVVPLSKASLSGMGGSPGPITVNLTVNAAPGMDERAVARMATEGVIRELRSSRVVRREFGRQLDGRLG